MAKAKRPTYAELEAQLIAVRKDRDDERGRRYSAEKEVETTREQFADLKQRLLNSENECARLNGYMARVHEDDIVRDGFVEIEDENGKRFVPKRPGPQERVIHHGGLDNYDYINGERRKKTHWTGY